MRKPSSIQGTKQESLISTKHKALLVLLVGTVATAAIVSTIQMVKQNEANQKQLQHDIKIQQILQERKTQEQIDAQKNELQEQIKTLEQRVEAKKANALAEAAKAAQSVATRVIPHAQASGVSGSKADWLRAAGIPEDVWQCADSLITKESGWRVNAQNPTSAAYGIPQSLPGSKMASAGADWQTNPVTQLRWMKSYVEARYGGFCNAWAHSQRVNWY